MTDQDSMDRLLRTWFAGEAAAMVPAHVLATVADATRGRGQQPGWLAWLTGARIRAGGGSHRRSGGLLLAFAFVTGILLALFAGGILSVGGYPVPAPFSHIYTSATPWSFGQPADICAETAAEAPAFGPLPRVGPPAIEHPGNGMIQAGDILIQPGTGLATTLHLPSEGWLSDGPRWSPDGHWLAIAMNDQGEHPTCEDVYLLSSDGTRLAGVTGYPGGGHTETVAWSPDASWLAVATWVADAAVASPSNGDPGMSAIDVLQIGPDGSVADARRVWSSESQGLEWLGWSGTGMLAWTYLPNDPAVAQMGMFNLRPGQTIPDVIDLGGVSLEDPRWTADGQALVALGTDAAGDFLQGIYVTTPATGAVRAATPPLGGKYAWDTELFTSSSGRIFYPGHTAATGTSDIYSALLDGTEIRKLTSFPSGGADGDWTFDAVLSPDENQVALGRYSDHSLWMVSSDGTAPAEHLAALNGTISWQPIP